MERIDKAAKRLDMSRSPLAMCRQFQVNRYSALVIDFLTAYAAGLRSMRDPEVLALAAGQNRVLGATE